MSVDHIEGGFVRVLRDGLNGDLRVVEYSKGDEHFRLTNEGYHLGYSGGDDSKLCPTLVDIKRIFERDGFESTSGIPQKDVPINDSKGLLIHFHKRSPSEAQQKIQAMMSGDKPAESEPTTATQKLDKVAKRFPKL